MATPGVRELLPRAYQTEVRLADNRPDLDPQKIADYRRLLDIRARY